MMSCLELDSRLSSCLDLVDSATMLRATSPRVLNNQLEVTGRSIPSSQNKHQKTESLKKSFSLDEKAWLAKSRDKTSSDKRLLNVADEFHIICYPTMQSFVDSMINTAQNVCPKRKLTPYSTSWGMFNDGTDDIKIEGMQSPSHFLGKHIIFVASFSDNAATMSQFHMITYLCECFVSTLTILLPYYSTGTMERVDIGADGVVPTASTLALLFSGLPSVGRPVRVMTYDLHTLQNRFYLAGHALATLHTAIPLIFDLVREKRDGINAIAFPDEGAHKRFGNLFKGAGLRDEDIVICSKVKSGDTKTITITEGNAAKKHVLIIDDQTKSGGTLLKCAEAILKIGGEGTKVSAYVSHAICTDEFWSKFAKDPTGLTPAVDILERFYTTDSVPGLDQVVASGFEKDLSWSVTAENDEGEMIKRPSRIIQAKVNARDIQRKVIILPLAALVLKDL